MAPAFGAPLLGTALVVHCRFYRVSDEFLFRIFSAAHALRTQSPNAHLANAVRGSLGACDRPLRVFTRTSYEISPVCYFQGAAHYRAGNIRRFTKINSFYFDTITS